MRSAESLIAELASRGLTDELVERLYELDDTALDALLACVLDATAEHHLRKVCAEVAGHIVPAGVGRLLALLQTLDGDEADLVAWGLRFNHAGDACEEALLGLLGDESPGVRANAVRALRYIGADLARCDLRLVNAVHDRDIRVRLDALRTLIELADIGFESYGISDIAPVILAVEASPFDEQLVERQLRRDVISLARRGPAR